MYCQLLVPWPHYSRRSLFQAVLDTASGVILLEIECSLASLVTGRLVSVFAPYRRMRVIRSRVCVFVLCVAGR